MKQRIFNLLLALVVIFGASSVAFAQSKALKKDVKKTCKEWRKEGWSLLATASTMEYALEKYRTYVEADEENRQVLTGIAVGRNPKIGRENAQMDGITSYASRAKAQVIGKMKSIASSDNTDLSTEEIDKFGAAYESGVNTKINSLVKIHFTLVRDKDGMKEFQVYMTLDESAAKQARELAAQEAKRKAALPELSQQVEDFIGEPVEPEE